MAKQVVSKGSTVSFQELPQPVANLMGFESSQERADFLEKVKRTRRYIGLYFEKHKDEISAAHNFGHIQRVAENAYLIAKALGADDRTAELARAAGYLHDCVRYPAEGKKHGPPSAKKAGKLMKFPLLEFSSEDKTIEIVDGWEKSQTVTFNDRQTILNAIEQHESNPEWWKDPRRKNTIPKNSQDLVQMTIRIADALLEAGGAFVMARRSTFVGGERLQGYGKDADLRGKGLTPYEAVACESFRRLRVVNPLDEYPEYLQPLARKLFEDQEKFYWALLAKLEKTEKQIAELANKAGMFRGNEWKTVQENMSQLDPSDPIRAVTPGQSEAAKEVIDYFSKLGTYNRDLNETIREWNPKTPWAYNMKQQMLKYLDGQVNITQEIRDGIAAARKRNKIT